MAEEMKQQASLRRTYKKEMVVARSTLVHLRHSARAQATPLCYGRVKLIPELVIQSQQLAGSSLVGCKVWWPEIDLASPKGLISKSPTHEASLSQLGVKRLTSLLSFKAFSLRGKRHEK
ncbi:hypothetical protein M9H77_37229 [Catharanthus roseus]|uniref:Uncharacterized protein n=1 Tax=Catharanthus roseus TaxID=4058 RepID=A0ACB9ZVX5_CATRO|nr:hypothetical protein M9H77_37229 [Catharanthus roseus]